MICAVLVLVSGVTTVPAGYRGLPGYDCNGDNLQTVPCKAPACTQATVAKLCNSSATCVGFDLSGSQAHLKEACNDLVRSTSASINFKAHRTDMPGFTCAGGLCRLVQRGIYSDTKCSGKCQAPPTGCSSPSDCNGIAHGDCVNGKCVCKTGFTGDHCELGACVIQSDCNNRGNCKDGVCQCDTQWSGRNCNTFTCIGKDHPTDCQMLTAIYDSMNGTAWGLSHWFKTGTSFCEWAPPKTAAHKHLPITCDPTSIATAEQTICTGGVPAAGQDDGPLPPLPATLHLSPCNPTRTSQQFYFSKQTSGYRVLAMGSRSTGGPLIYPLPPPARAPHPHTSTRALSDPPSPPPSRSSASMLDYRWCQARQEHAYCKPPLQQQIKHVGRVSIWDDCRFSWHRY
jgi:hypothetical protein